MSFSLVNLVLWPLAALVAVPVLIHLFARAKPPEYRFSSIQFLRRVVRTTIRLKRPRDLLLLAARTLLAAAVVAVFLRPILFTDRRLGGGAGQRSIVIIVDASASMAYMEAAQARFAQACAQASERLSAARPGDLANVVWMRARPETVFPEVGSNIPMLQDALRRTRVSAEPADVEGAVRMAVDMLSKAPGKREICLISDFQKTVWAERALTVPPGIALVAVRVGREDGLNRAITRIDVTPPVALAGETVTISCEVGNFEPVPRRAAVYLGAGESRQKHEVSLPAWGRGTVAFTVRFPSPGSQTVHAELDEDAFPGDDQRWRVVEVRDRLRVGVLSSGSGTAERWIDALEALGWAHVTRLQDEDLDQTLEVDAALLEGWDGRGAKGVGKLLARGGTVVWMPARDTVTGRLTAMATGTDTGVAAGERVAWEQGGSPHTLRVAKPEDPLFEVFASGEHGDPAKGSFRARLAIPSAALPAGAAVLAYEDGVPALARLGTHAPVWLWNMPLAGDMSDWARQPEYLALLGELLLGGWGGARRGEDDAVPGERLTWASGRELLQADVSLEDDAGNRLPVVVKAGSEGAMIVSDPVPSPGLYTWRNRSQSLGTSAVSFSVIESDLRACQPGAIERMGFAVADAGGSVRNLHEGVPLWPTLLGVASALVLIEAGLVIWAGKTP